MIKTIKPLLISGLLVAGISTASAALIDPGLMNDFQDGSVGGWKAGTASADENLLPHIVNGDGDNKYLKVEAFANDNGKKSGANRRMVFFNDSTWHGDFSQIAAISADFKATSSEESALHLRLSFVSGEGDQRRFYSSKDAFVVATDGQWNSASFALAAENFFVNAADDELGEAGEDFSAVDANQFAAAIAGIHEIKFLSNEDYPQWAGVDVIRAELGVDNLAVSAVTTVPVPGAVWLMATGLIGLSSFSARKRRQA